MIRIDGEGNVIWEKIFPNLFNTWRIAGSIENGYAVSGLVQNATTRYWDVYVLKFDDDGDEVWSRTYACVDIIRVRDIVETGDGGYLVAGIVEHGSSMNQYVYLLRVGSEGEKVWENVWDRVWFDRATAHSVVQSGDGGFVIAGVRSDDAYICRIDGQGNKIWEKTYGTNRSENIKRIIRTHDGGFVLIGSSDGYTEGGYDIYLLKVDGDGDKVWERTYGGEGSESGAAVVEVSPDCYLIAGTAESLDDRYSVYLVKTCLGMPVPLAGSPSVAFLVVSVLAVLPIASKRA